MRKLFCLLLAVVMVLGCSFACGEGTRYEGEGFDTPEAAVTCYLEGLKNLDFEQMLQAYAWETQAEHYSVEASLRRLQMYSPTVWPRMPVINEFMETATLEVIRANEIRSIYSALETYILGGDYPDGRPVDLREEAAAEEFLERFDSGKLEKLAGMSEIQFAEPEALVGSGFSAEKNQESYRKMTAKYGADEVRDIVAGAEVAGGVIACMPAVARYGEKWYMVSVNSMTAMMLGLPATSQAFVFVEGSIADYVGGRE